MDYGVLTGPLDVYINAASIIARSKQAYSVLSITPVFCGKNGLSLAADAVACWIVNLGRLQHHTLGLICAHSQCLINIWSREGGWNHVDKNYMADDVDFWQWWWWWCCLWWIIQEDWLIALSPLCSWSLQPNSPSKPGRCSVTRFPLLPLYRSFFIEHSICCCHQFPIVLLAFIIWHTIVGIWQWWCLSHTGSCDMWCW